MSNAKSTRFAQNDECPPFRFCLFGIVFILLTCLFPTPSVYPAAAASDAFRWTKVNIPSEGKAGRWALAAGSDIRHLAVSADGTLYAGVSGLPDTLYRSTDGGSTWEQTGNVPHEIAGIAVSPDDTVYYATPFEVYRSTDGGRTFEALPPHPGGAGADNIEITSIDVARLHADIIIIGTRDNDSGEFGGLYTLDVADIIPDWEDTGVGSYDVVTAAFSPDYGATQQMVAVVTGETDTRITVKTGDTAWNDEIGYARLDAEAVSAEIAFPVWADTGIIPEDFLCFVAIATGTGEGDVFRIEGSPGPGLSTAIDLNAGSAYGRGDIDVSALSAYDDGSNTILLAGAAETAVTYTSADGGATWTRSRKPPTGDSLTGVLIGADFSTTCMMYAFTGGEESALSISRDNGTTWNQLSFIDTALNTIVDVAPSPRYSQDSTLFLLTFGSGPGSQGLWRSRDGGGTWERTLSGQADGVDTLRKVALPPEYGDDCRAVFVAGESRGNPAVWESTDSGQNWRRRFTRDPTTGAPLPIDAWVVAGETTFFIASYDGIRAAVYRSVDSGTFFSVGIPAGSQPLHSIALSPEYAYDGTILAGNTAGLVYLADNTSSSFEPLIGDGAPPPFSGLITVAFDPDFRVNRIVYAVDDAPDLGIFRFEIGSAEAWENIDGALPAGATLNGITIGNDGVLYAVSSVSGGGIERSLNPAASEPAFETVSRGLAGGATLYGLWQVDRCLWAVDTTGTKLLNFADTLTSPPLVLSPDRSAAAIGELLDHTVRGISLDWETMDGATGYEWECGYDDDFSSGYGKFTNSTAGTSARLPALDPATTYYWRVRASSPAFSPWSVKRSFTTVMDTEAVTLRPESPAAGATGVAVKPVFQWTAVIGARAYELIVATDATMDSPVISRTGGYALPGNVWLCEVSLEYAMTYYWKVRATGDGTRSAWSTTGVFTTEAAPSPESMEATPAPVQDHEETTLPKTFGTVAAMAVNPNPVPIEPLSTPATDGIILPDLNELPGVPDLVIYLVGILLSIIILSLLVILAIILRLKRLV